MTWSFRQYLHGLHQLAAAVRPLEGLPKSFKVASSQTILASGASYAHLANITSSLFKLPPPLQIYLSNTIDQIGWFSEYLQSATGLSSTTILSTAGAVLLLGAIPTVAALISPFASNLTSQGTVSDVTDEDFSYITSEDLQNHGLDVSSGRDNLSRADAGRVEEDVLLIKHQGITYPEHFPAFSIGDEQLNVNDVRDRVRMTMQLPDRRARGIRLYYKGQLLDDPDRPVCLYGVKHNSELMVVVPDAASAGGGDSIEETVAVGREGSRKSSKNKRRKHKKRDDGDEKSPRESRSNGGLEVPVDDLRPAPGSPMDKLNTVASHFTTKLLPLCAGFTANPPADSKKREDEHRKLSETVMQQVLLKLDEVDTQGDEAVRTRRKELVRTVQEVLKGLDEA
ncbi:hypothetical protein P8C59_003746 [Phyllachora maydis]|uniref:BAG domain-containing protein n=1 Tax=Phyllachora maydis TaxID=1825666 RepID=A0AAD9I0Z4_9PEZI|nr:hypothetical protein P8C59_003746 [Phyllachora maydis]